MKNSFFHYQKQVNRLNVTLFALNDSYGRQKTKKKTSTNFKNRILNYRNCSPKPLIFEITSLWIKQIVILELSYLNFHRFCFDLVCMCMTTSTRMRRTKTMADVGHQRFTKSVLSYPTPYWKIIKKFHYRLFWCWLILINAKMLIMPNMKFKFIRFCWLSKFLA